MSFTVELPKDKSSIIKVVGVGGGGGNAVNHMYREGINGVDFFICNTDAQALENSPIPNRIQIGNALTEGRGAGSNPEVGRKAAEENIKEIIESLGVNTQMVFVTAGMGGGTGTGAAPVIAKAAKDMGILTVGIITTPFSFEGGRRCDAAFHGIEEMRESVDSLLVISNDRIKEIYGNLPISKAFGYADNVLTTAAKGIAEIITIAGSINVDFEDVKTAMSNSGVSIMGMGLSEGDDRAMRAVNQALNSPLLDDNKIQGASDLLVNISYGDEEATMDEYAAINEFLQSQAGRDATLKCGLCFDSSLGNAISVTVIATGFNRIENKYKTTLGVNDEVEFDLGAVTVSKNGMTDEVPQKQTTIFDQLGDYEEDETVAANQKIEQMKQRMKYLRELNESANKENGVEELENVPAYKRKGINLEDVAHSSEMEISRTSLIEEPEKKPELRTNNSFLHDNVD
ncbi:MAG: cell division protein FtsZ [Bacteroidia bacterium]|jgi:cell division protein FtsZ